MRSKLMLIFFGMMSLSAIEAALAEQVNATQLAIVALDATLRDGEGKTTKLSVSYENLYWRFLPMSNTARDIDLDGEFTLVGPAPGLISAYCDKEKGARIFYPSRGTSRDEYRCKTSKVKTEGTLSRKGNIWTIKGKLTGSMDYKISTEQWTITEDAVLRIADGKCSVVSFARIRTVATKNDPMGDKMPTVSRVVSGPRARCAFN